MVDAMVGAMVDALVDVMVGAMVDEMVDEPAPVSVKYKGWAQKCNPFRTEPIFWETSARN